MAAVSQPGSRTGIIASLIVFVVLFFVAAVMAIVSFSDKGKLEKQVNEMKNLYDKAIKKPEMADNHFAELKDLIDSKERGRSAFDILIQQREGLARAITG